MMPNLNSIRYQAPGTPFTVSISAQGSRILAALDDRLVAEFSSRDEQLQLVQEYTGPERDRLYLHVMECVLSHRPELDALDATDLVRALPARLRAAIAEERKERFFVDRQAFFQYPAIWHRRQNEEFLPERWTTTQGRAHPQRAFYDPGLLYRRYLPSIRRTLSFELFDRQKHLDVFHAWHNQARIARIWELAEPREKLDAYIQAMEEDPHQRPLIACLDDEPIGYYEVYWTPEDRLGPYYEYEPFDRGFHFLIGDGSVLGGKGTADFIQSIVHFIFLDDRRTRRVMGEPRADNAKIMHYAETLRGWVKLKEFDFPHKRAALLQIRREDFFVGGHL